MNLYFLVEGETERKVYEKWVAYEFPNLRLVERIKDIQSNAYYIVSGGGIPAIIDRIEDAFEEIKLAHKILEIEAKRILVSSWFFF
ncbi:MAG: hypothetical protein ABFS56_04955 [Pseudomonadota bacterium]